MQWSLEECRRIVSLHFRVVHASSLTFLPFVPMLWRALLPLADRVGPLFLPRSGGNTFIVARRP